MSYVKAYDARSLYGDYSCTGPLRFRYLYGSEDSEIISQLRDRKTKTHRVPKLGSPPALPMRNPNRVKHQDTSTIKQQARSPSPNYDDNVDDAFFSAKTLFSPDDQVLAFSQVRLNPFQEAAEYLGIQNDEQVAREISAQQELFEISAAALLLNEQERAKHQTQGRPAHFWAWHTPRLGCYCYHCREAVDALRLGWHQR